MVYGDDDNFTKFGRIAHTSGRRREVRVHLREQRASPRNEAADSTANIPADFPDDFWVRLTSDGTNVVGHYSTDGSDWTPVGRPAPMPANAQIGLFAFSNDGTGNPVAAFDSFTLTGHGTRRWRRHAVAARATTTSSTTRRSTRRVGTRSSATRRRSTAWPAAS